jgi:phosphoglycolate phosphatase
MRKHQPNNMTKLIIFDLDGTLIDSLADLAASTNHTLRAHGFPEHPLDSYRHFVGNGVLTLIERALPDGARDGATIREILDEFTRYYGLHRGDLTAPYPGIKATLNAIRDRGTRLAVASNKYHSAALAMTRQHFGPRTFDIVLGHTEDLPLKPHPAILLEILAEMDVAAGDALYVGDSGVDMQTAAAAGIRSIGVTWGFRPRRELLDAGARFIVDDPAGILPIAYP